MGGMIIAPPFHVFPLSLVEPAAFSALYHLFALGIRQSQALACFLAQDIMQTPISPLIPAPTLFPGSERKET